MKYFVFETYLKNPITGEIGWDIEHVGVSASTYEEAKERLTHYPNYDCRILSDGQHELDSEYHDFIVIDYTGEVVKRINID